MKVKKIEIKSIYPLHDGPYEVILIAKNGKRFKMTSDARRINNDNDTDTKDTG